MHPQEHKIGEAGLLQVIRTEKFKSGLLSVSTVLPITGRGAVLAPLLLSVLRRGTKKYPTLAAINRRLEYLWGTGFSIRSFTRGNCLVLGFAADLLDPAYLPPADEDLTDAVVELICEMLFSPLTDADGLLSARYVESEKQQQCDYIRAKKNNPAAYAAGRCSELMLAGEPAGNTLYGTEEETLAVTREELTAFWREWIATLSPTCFYVGSADAAALAKKLEPIFVNFKADRAPASVWPIARHLAPATPRYVTESLPVRQSQLILGLRCNIFRREKEFYACCVMNELLGNSPISRLFVHVREKQSLCYSCSSVYSSFFGLLFVRCGLAEENRSRAEAEILRQLRAVAEGDFTDAELDAAKGSIENAYRQIEDSPADLESFFFQNRLTGQSLTPAEFRRGISEVDRRGVMQTAERLTVDTVYFLQGTLPADNEEDEDEADI